MLKHTRYDMQINIRIRTIARLISSSPKSTCTVCSDIVGKYIMFVAEGNC